MTTKKYCSIADVYIPNQQAITWGNDLGSFQISCTVNANQQLKYIIIGY